MLRYIYDKTIFCRPLEFLHIRHRGVISPTEPMLRAGLLNDG